MAEVEISASSTIYVKVPISARVAGARVDPTSDTVKLAFMRNGATPGVGDLRTGSWETDEVSDPNGDIYLARCLVGSGGTGALAVGLYTVWVQVTDNPETVLLKAPAPLRVI